MVPRIDEASSFHHPPPLGRSSSGACPFWVYPNCSIFCFENNWAQPVIGTVAGGFFVEKDVAMAIQSVVPPFQAS
jgi:hypothetical protein